MDELGNSEGPAWMTFCPTALIGVTTRLISLAVVAACCELESILWCPRAFKARPRRAGSINSEYTGFAPEISVFVDYAHTHDALETTEDPADRNGRRLICTSAAAGIGIG